MTRPVDHAKLARMVHAFGAAIQRAQMAIDRKNLELLMEMMDPELGIALPGDDLERSLLDLGFAPSFYHIQAVDIDIRMSVTTRTREGWETRIGGLDLPGTELGGTPVNAGQAGRYSYPPEDGSGLFTRIVPVPAPLGLQRLLDEKQKWHEGG